MNPRQTRRALDMLTVAVATVTLAAVAYTSLPGIVGLDSGDRIERPVSAGNKSTVNGTGRFDIDRVVSAHLFGEPDTKQTADVENAPETKLQLRLMGMVSSANDRYARALIGVNASEVNAYGVGESVEGTDAEIRSVEPTRVLLNRNGAVESLYLKLPDLTGSSTGNRPAEPEGMDEPPGFGEELELSEDPLELDEDRLELDEDPLELDEHRLGLDDEAAGFTNEIPYTGVRETTGKQNKLPF